jgi:hypothetical protein
MIFPPRRILAFETHDIAVCTLQRVERTSLGGEGIILLSVPDEDGFSRDLPISGKDA